LNCFSIKILAVFGLIFLTFSKSIFCIPPEWPNLFPASLKSGELQYKKKKVSTIVRQKKTAHSRGFLGSRIGTLVQIFKNQKAYSLVH